jgi:putative membrane protein
MPDGFLAPRGNLLTDVVFICNLIAPVWALIAARSARRGEHARHMRLQLSLWSVMFINLLLLEGYIRLSGGSGSLMAGSPHAGTALIRIAFALHIGPAVATYVLWAGLVVVTYRRRIAPALGGFSARHALLGKVVIGGLIWTALSACSVYYLTFWA